MHRHFAFLARRGEKVRERARRNVGHGPIADLLRREVVEVRWHLVEQNQDGAVALEEVQPVPLSSGASRAGCPELR